jgi:hypothetical protein
MRLIQRVPSAELIGVAEYPNHKLTFNKLSGDSGKCNIVNSGNASDVVYGAIYKLQHEHKNMLDRVEGNGFGYIDKKITLKYNGNDYSCFTYIAQPSCIIEQLKPYHWYKKLVILGAQYLKFPASYIASIEAVRAKQDPSSTIREQQEKLIENIILNN